MGKVNANFTPLIDEMVADKDIGIIGAHVYGVVWRWCQMEDKECRVSLEKLAGRCNTSRRTVIRYLKKLCDKGYIKDHTPKLRNRPHTYTITEKASVNIKITGNGEGVTESHTKTEARGDRESPSQCQKVTARSDRESLEETLKETFQETTAEAQTSTIPDLDVVVAQDDAPFITEQVGETPNGRRTKDPMQVMAGPVYKLLRSHVGIGHQKAAKGAMRLSLESTYGAVFYLLNEWIHKQPTPHDQKGALANHVADPHAPKDNGLEVLARLSFGFRRELVLAARALQANPANAPETVAPWLPPLAAKHLTRFLEVCTRGPSRDPTKHYAWRDDSALWPAVVAWAGEGAFSEELEPWIDSKLEVAR